MSLLVVGTVAFDAIETPFGKTDKVLGGSATYICTAASYFCKPQYLVSVVGDDMPGEVIKGFQKKGIDTAGLQIIQGEKSFFWSGRYHNDMNSRDTLVTDLNVLASWQPDLPEAYREAEYVMLGNIDPTLQIRVLEQLSRKPKMVLMDTMNYWMDNTPEALTKVLHMVDALTINDEEARQLSGEYSLVKAAKKIFEMGPKLLIIKKGENGALLFMDNQVFFAPALPLEEVFDPTGAGDSFAGGFIGHLAKTSDLSFENMKRALIFGSVMASFCVEKFGPTRLQELDSKSIDKRVDQFKALSSFSMDM